MISKSQKKYISQLTNKKFREKEGLFIAEGKKIIEEVLLSEIIVEHLYASEGFLQKHSGSINSKRIKSTPITDIELKIISCLKEPDDALAICRIPEYDFTFSKNTSDLIIYIDDIRDPGNLGSIIRICDWFGVKKIICSPGTVDLYNPKTIQSTMGSFLRTNVFYMELEKLIEKQKILTGTEITIYGATMEGTNIYRENELHSGVIVIGNEANGISPKNINLIDRKICIPKTNSKGPESLNAAIATALILGEFRRRKMTN